MVSYKTVSYKTATWCSGVETTVLILVVVEDGLVQAYDTPVVSEVVVLILVVVEDGLVLLTIYLLI